MKSSGMIKVIVFFLLMIPAAAWSQSCEYNIPYYQNFNQDFALDNGWVHTDLDTTLVYQENCWTQYIYRTMERWPFVAYLPHETSYVRALRLCASKPTSDPNRVETTYMISPSFRETPYIVTFDYCNMIVSPEKDAQGNWIDITSQHDGILQLGYIADTSLPETSYQSIINILMNPENGATDIMHHFRLDLRSMFDVLPPIKQLGFKILTDITGVRFTNIYIDNFRVSQEMDTVNYRDTICPGETYSKHGFTVDSTETTIPGLYTFNFESMESYGMVHFRLKLWVQPPDTSYVDASLALGGTLRFCDSLIVDTGVYVFNLQSARGCDSIVVLHVTPEEVSLSSSSQKVCAGAEVILTASGTAIFHWASVPADPALVSLQGRNPIAVHPVMNTEYQLLDADGQVLCSVSVETESCEGLWFPNAFTPNAESNNRFVIQTTLPIEEFEMTVYTRTGLLVWHCEDINQPWDGTRNGVPMPQGAYVYHWRLKSNNRVRSGLGTITLLR